MEKLDKIKLLQEIREKDIEINNINDLIKINEKYKDLVPILLKFLNEVDDLNDKEFLVRCLGVKGFSEASKVLIQEFYQSESVTYKWAIGNTLSIISDAETIPELLIIAQDKKHGISRQMIVNGLGVFKTDEIKATLINLLSDEEVVGHAIDGLSKTGDKSVVKYIEPYLTYKVPWVRKAAAKAIKKLRKC